MPDRNESKMCGEAPAAAVGEAEGGKPSEPDIDCTARTDRDENTRARVELLYSTPNRGAQC